MTTVLAEFAGTITYNDGIALAGLVTIATTSAPTGALAVTDRTGRFSVTSPVADGDTVTLTIQGFGMAAVTVTQVVAGPVEGQLFDLSRDIGIPSLPPDVDHNVPAGGTTGEALLKTSDADYDTGWGHEAPSNLGVADVATIAPGFQALAVDGTSYLDLTLTGDAELQLEANPPPTGEWLSVVVVPHLAGHALTFYGSLTFPFGAPAPGQPFTAISSDGATWLGLAAGGTGGGGISAPILDRSADITIHDHGSVVAVDYFSGSATLEGDAVLAVI